MFNFHIKDDVKESDLQRLGLVQQNEFAEITQELILFPLNSAKLLNKLYALHLIHLLKSSAKWSRIAGQHWKMRNWSGTAANNTVPYIYVVPATLKDAEVIYTEWGPSCQTVSLALTLVQDSRPFWSKTPMTFSTQRKRESLWSLEIPRSSPHVFNFTQLRLLSCLRLFPCLYFPNLGFLSFPSSQLQTYIWRFHFGEAPSTWFTSVESSNTQTLWLSGHKYKRSKYLYPATSPLLSLWQCCSQLPQGLIYPQDWHFKFKNMQFIFTVLKDNKYSVLNYWIIHLT